jgi:hypothetical protein
VIIARVNAIFMRRPVPYGPPLQPVFTSQTRASCRAILLAQHLRVAAGRAAAERRAEQVLNVAFGSVTPFSVPATSPV